jgi:hypothetical protein
MDELNKKALIAVRAFLFIELFYLPLQPARRAHNHQAA